MTLRSRWLTACERRLPPAQIYEEREKADHSTSEPERRRESDDDEGDSNRVLHLQRARGRMEFLESDALGPDSNADRFWTSGFDPWAVGFSWACSFVADAECR